MATQMAMPVNAGGRLDRLPISSFHYRIFLLVGAGMLFDGYDLYVFTNVLPAAAQSGFSTPLQNADFISKTFLGMTIEALATGFLGDHYGRRFTYQINLLIFGLASLAAPFAPDMTALIWLRFVMGLGLGAEIVVGYSTLTEFVPPRSRGRWLSFMTVVVVSGLGADHRAARIPDHPGLRLATDVRHRRRRCAHCLVLATGDAGIAALARGAGPRRGSRGRDAGDRAGGRQRRPAAAARAGSPGRKIRPRLARVAIVAAPDARGQLGADNDQHAYLWLRYLVAAVLPAARSPPSRARSHTRW